MTINENTNRIVVHSQREELILELLREHRTLPVADFVSQLGVSEATVRRLLQNMDERHLLKRVHGGATLRTVLNAREPLFQDKENRNRQNKSQIAEAALAHIEDHDRIFLDGGSTVLLLARLLERKKDLTIVTNSLMAAAELMTTGHRLILVGGEFRPLSRTLVGPLTCPIINSIRISKAFMGTIGFSVEDGMTTTDPNEAMTKEQIMRRADQVILLVDSSKLGVSSFARSGEVSDINLLITDNISANLRTALEEKGITVQITTAETQD